jgi:2-oxo-4-hydroxy-4-carboxy-5-ureidoimidazoline decarboxylase
MPDIQAISAMDRDRFTAALGPVFEHSPWIAERAWDARPFATPAALHAAMVAVLRAASPEKRLALIRAHPDLAGKAARAGTITAESQGEQGGAGLDRLSTEEFARFERLNAAYRERFGFPFVIAVRGLDKAQILDAFERRLGNDAAAEMDTALDQIAAIGRMRLDAMLGDAGRA